MSKFQMKVAAKQLKQELKEKSKEAGCSEILLLEELYKEFELDLKLHPPKTQISINHLIKEIHIHSDDQKTISELKKTIASELIAAVKYCDIESGL